MIFLPLSQLMFRVFENEQKDARIWSTKYLLSVMSDTNKIYAKKMRKLLTKCKVLRVSYICVTL